MAQRVQTDWVLFFTILGLVGFGLLMLYFFAFRLRLFPVGGYGTLSHLVLPALTVALPWAAWYGIVLRSNMLDSIAQDYARTAAAKGLSRWTIAWRHLLPNALAPVWVSATFGVAGAILTESGLSFLGFGVPPPAASWGEVLKQSQTYITYAWWLVTFPGAAIFITVTAFNLVGEGLRDAMDPRLRQ